MFYIFGMFITSLQNEFWSAISLDFQTYQVFEFLESLSASLNDLAYRELSMVKALKVTSNFLYVDTLAYVWSVSPICFTS